MFAKTKKKTLLEQASDFATDVTEALAPHVENAKAQAAPKLADAKAAAAPKLENARDSLLNDVVPVIAAAIASAKDDAIEKATPLAEEAKSRGANAVDALKGEQPKKRGKGRKVLLLAALVGAGVAVAKRLQASNQQATAWQSNYKPTPNTPAPSVGSHAASVPPPPVANDAAAATPGEALSDSTDSPHAASDPDAPLDKVDVSDVPDPDVTKK